MGLNIVIIQGRLTREPETAYTNNNKFYATFDLAVPRNKEDTDFINCIVWNNTAENLCKFCGKGSSIEVVGTIIQETWEKNNKTNSRLRVLAERIYFLNTKKSENDNQNVTSSKSINDAVIEQVDDFPF